MAKERADNPGKEKSEKAEKKVSKDKVKKSKNKKRKSKHQPSSEASDNEPIDVEDAPEVVEESVSIYIPWTLEANRTAQLEDLV